MTRLENPLVGAEVEWVQRHLGDLTCDEAHRSGRFVGTQAAADRALDGLDIARYAQRRNEVLPVSRRGASGLSPYIRHGLLDLPTVWNAVNAAPGPDRQKFRDELLWQEYARHVYGRLGRRLSTGLRAEPATHERGQELGPRPVGHPDAELGGPRWDRTMACIDTSVTELERDGWLVNQTRMWLASQWTIRQGHRWQEGEDRFFTHLLDGSRAANRLGWQWTIGAGTGKHYGFSQWQVRKRAPSLCGRCERRDDCPIADWPSDPTFAPVPPEPLLRHDVNYRVTAGPSHVETSPHHPAAVWLTAESLGARDPALAAHPELPVIFVFDEPLLRRLRLSSKRLVFLVDRLAELATDRTIEVHRCNPAAVLTGRRLSTTFTPVPKWHKLTAVLDVVETHPWPWLRRPGPGSIASFSAWRKSTAPSS